MNISLHIVKRIARPALLVLALLAALTGMLVRLDFRGHLEGLFLLRGNLDWRYELKDHLYVGDGERLILAFDWNDPRYRLFRKLKGNVSTPHLYYEWDAEDGSGFIRNFLGNGRETFTSFGRFTDGEGGSQQHGLFLGGTLPANIIGNDNESMNQSGMAYTNGTRWYHLWCNVNEALISPYSRRSVTPSEWEFLGSRVINGGSKAVVLSSSHMANVDNAPLRIDRFVYLHAGDTYFLLTVMITNIGRERANFYYVYGDEPWTGNYGSSKGNVGWVKDRLIEYETVIDSRKYSYAGMFDYGNGAIGEGHDFTGTASFIQWFGKEHPEVYFANDVNGISNPGAKTPLQSDTRFIGLQWGPRQLAPRQSAVYAMAIGMAGHDPVTGFPQKPEVRIDDSLLRGTSALSTFSPDIDGTPSPPR